jgi:hypothetical protein
MRSQAVEERVAALLHFAQERVLDRARRVGALQAAQEHEQLGAVGALEGARDRFALERALLGVVRA